MNRLIFTAFLLLATFHGTFAQNEGSVKYDDLYSPKVSSISEGKGQLERYHGSLMFVETNRFLSANDVTNAFWKKYYGAKRLQSWGQYLWGLGLSYMATDLIFDLVYRNDRNLLKDPSFLLGGALALIGGSMDFGGWVRLGNLANTYNSDPTVRKEYTLNFGPTRSGGMGLTLNF